MKNILCFGDSNTWGFIPSIGSRYPSSIRWTGKLKEFIGNEYNIIEDGLNGRTTVFNDPIEPYRSGIDSLPYSLLSQSPLDLIIIMLGTNDTKIRFNVTSTEITKGVEQLIKKIHTVFLFDKNPPKILIVSPVPLRDAFPKNDSFDSTSVIKSRELAESYKSLATQFKCEFLNSFDYVTELGSDNVHFTVECHELLAKALSIKIKSLNL